MTQQDSETLYVHVGTKTPGLVAVEYRPADDQSPTDAFVLLLHEGYPIPSDLPDQWAGRPVSYRVLDKSQVDDLRTSLTA